MKGYTLTPTEQIVPHQVLLLRKHSHHDESVQIDPLTQHPEVITPEKVQMDELRHFAADLKWKIWAIKCDSADKK